MEKRVWKMIALMLATTLAALVLIVGQTLTATASAPSESIVAQVTSVSQFSDVAQTDYYFQPLQSLAERYGCVAAYQDASFRSERPVVRAELVGMLNACLDRLNELVAGSTVDLVKSDSLDPIRRNLDEISAAIKQVRR